MGTFSSWLSYITGLPLLDGEVFAALSALDVAIDDLSKAENISYSYGTYFDASVNSVKLALNQIAQDLVVGLGTIHGGNLQVSQQGVTGLANLTTYGRWIMGDSGTFGYVHFRVETAPAVTDCEIEIRVNGVALDTYIIPAGDNAGTVLDLSLESYVAGDVIDVYCTVASAAADLCGTIQV